MSVQEFFSFSPDIEKAARLAQDQAAPAFERIDGICEHNCLKVLAAFGQERVSESHLQGSSGYGYDDRGRDGLDALYARIFGAEDALVRHNFSCGTAAIATALFGVLRPGDKIVSITGRPYDTLHPTLGINSRPGQGSLAEFGVEYAELELLPDGGVDEKAVPTAVKGARVVYIQRSRGYSLRPSVDIAGISRLCQLAKKANPDCVVVVDNCYGEFVEKLEPTQVGADLAIGSLIKNPGGGIARTGGYIVGRSDLVEQCAHRLTAPGLGREVGCSLGESKNMYMGLFYAPGVVASAVKTAILAAALFESLGYQVHPKAGDNRTDIIQSVVLGSPEKLSAFCRGIQKGAPIDSFVTPEAWDMPGYENKIIMAAGAFNMGASIELSADGPMRPPYPAWMQGGLNYPCGKLGVMMAAQELEDICPL